MRWLLLFAVAVALASASFVPVDVPRVEMIQIHNDHLVYLFMGNPGKWLRFRVRMDTSDVYVFRHPSPYSSTWKALPRTDSYGQQWVRDSLLIGQTHVRADVIIGSFDGETPPTVEGTQAEGILGLGSHSPLWSIWRNFTISRDLLVLGRVVSRVADVANHSLVAAMPPAWLFGPGKIDSFIGEYRAIISSDSRKHLRATCLSSLGSVIDNAAELVESDYLLAMLLDVDEDECLCCVAEEYRVILMPHSDYNAIPSVLMMHTIGKPPSFRLESIMENQSAAHDSVVLFNRFEDMYLDIDMTNSAGAAVRRMANRIRPGANNTIIMGAYGMRRFEAAYALDKDLMWINLKHVGFSVDVRGSRIERSVETRRTEDIYALVAGLFVWALLATEPDPIYPRHRRARKDGYAHSDIANNFQGPVIPTKEVNAASDDFVYSIPKAPVLTPAPTTDAKAPAVKEDKTHIRILAVISSTFLMEVKWRASTSDLLWVQALVEALVAAYFAMALGIYNVPWALTSVLAPSAKGDWLGWMSVGFIVLSVVIFSLVATLSTGRDARLASLALQFEMLVSLFMVLISFFEWDLALALTLIVGSLALIVLLMCLLAATGLVPQYHRRLYSPRRHLMPAAVVAGLSWVIYMSLWVFPFAINRLWDNLEQSTIVGILITLGLVIPISIYLSVTPFIYPVMVANVAIERILAARPAHR